MQFWGKFYKILGWSPLLRRILDPRVRYFSIPTDNLFLVYLTVLHSLLSGVRKWPWLKSKEKEAKEKVEKKLREKDDTSQSNHYKDVTVFHWKNNSQNNCNFHGYSKFKNTKTEANNYLFDSNQEEATEEERSKLLESQENEISFETLSDMEREITKRSGVDGFFHDRRVRQTSCIRFHQLLTCQNSLGTHDRIR